MEIFKRAPSTEDFKGALTIKASGGIANRMEYIHHVIATVREADVVWRENASLPRYHSKRINILWQKRGYEMAAEYDDIFKPIEDKHIAVFNQDAGVGEHAYDVYYGAYSRPRHFLSKIKHDPKNIAYDVKTFLLQDHKKLRRIHSVFDKMIRGVELRGLVKGGQLGEGSIYIRDHYWEGYPKLLVAFELRDELQQRVLSLVKQFGESIIGVHVRQSGPYIAPGSNHFTDQQTCESFAALMQREIDENPDTKFFLASDHLKIKEELMSRFGTRVVTQEHTITRDTVEGVQAGAVDLYALAQTDRILCRTGSFARWALAIRGISCQRIRLENDGIVRMDTP